ncbi:MAG: phosphate acyltransferase PlsX [Firmicutes bacterium]|nr:phosphate acyltransferase PlsX [Bacillota bacterium]
MRFAIDAMGGDKAPDALIQGTLQAAEHAAGDQFILVGGEEARPAQPLPANVSWRTSSQVMAMDENVQNLLKKRDSSIWIATKMVKDGEADAVISAGSTAAQMAVAVILLGKIDHLLRPAIAITLPSLEGQKIFLDIGVNADVEPPMLLQFAQMGAVYAQAIGVAEQPRVGLLSNGTEEHKGNTLTQEAYALLNRSDLNFIGNREGRDLLNGGYDVMVTDGFSGNIAIKSMESAFHLLTTILKKELTAGFSRKMGALLIKPALREMKKALDYQAYGGAPLLGVKGLSIVCHGSSGAEAIAASFQQARNCYQHRLTDKIAEAIL